ncbi:MAG TPA: type VI secretion system baseplate subunit TssG [Bryobacteraceae bacterium]|nr:type VI secretion system baseplate subunit TssG [Bryobacteraceae bacterium]
MSANQLFGWRSGCSAIEWLLAEPYRFEFHQAVRMIEQAFGVTPSFRSRTSFEFPASEIHSLKQEKGKRTVTVHFLGLAGVLGPLPHPFSELVISDKSGVAAAFLDIFNNRLLELFHEATRRHQPSLTARAPDEGPVAAHLFALMGLGHPRVRRSAGAMARSLPAYAGLLSRPIRTAVGMERILEDHFGVPVRVEQFAGKWCDLEPDQFTSLGRNGRNQRLGQDVVLGKRVWDEIGGVTVIVGPLHLNDYVSFLPGRGDHPVPGSLPLPPRGARRTELEKMIRFCLGTEHTAEIELRLMASEIPPSELAPGAGPRLGFTSFLHANGSPPRAGDALIRAEEG